MSTSAPYDFRCEATETIELSGDNFDDPTIKHDFAVSGTLNASSTPPATKSWSDQRTLSGGTDTLDLEALVQAGLSNINMTGLKVQLIKIFAASANTAVLVVKDGTTNGYNIFGDASGQVSIPAGGTVMLFGNDGLQDIAASDSEIDITSTDADAIYDILIVAG